MYGTYIHTYYHVYIQNVAFVCMYELVYVCNVCMFCASAGKVEVQENIARAMSTLCCERHCTDILIRTDILSDLIVIALLKTSRCVLYSCVCIHICMYVCMQACMYGDYIALLSSKYVYVCMYVCMYVFVRF